MEEKIQAVIGLCYMLTVVILIILSATRRNLPGKIWFISSLVIILINMFAWQLPGLLVKYGNLDFDISNFYDHFAIILQILNFLGFCLLFPFLFAVSNPSHYLSSLGDNRTLGDQHRIADTTNPLYGVHGWLKFFVVVNMYIAPVIFAIQQIMGFIGFGMLAKHYPGIVVVGIIEAAVGIFFVIKWIMIACRLRDIVPGVIQEVKTWMLITLAWNVLSTPLVFISGIDPEDAMPGVLRQFLGGIISFAIWYSYFNVSKRVKATYPDTSTGYIPKTATEESL